MGLSSAFKLIMAISLLNVNFMMKTLVNNVINSSPDSLSSQIIEHNRANQTTLSPAPHNNHSIKAAQTNEIAKSGTNVFVIVLIYLFAMVFLLKLVSTKHKKTKGNFLSKAP